MVLNCLGSGSKGNCYILEASDGEVLVIEAGIAIAEIKRALKWQLRRVAGCLISHQHKDHAKYLKDVLSSGINTYALADVFNSLTLSNRVFCKEILPKHGYKVGTFKVFTLDVRHDVPCLGFIIEHEEMGKLLFITDTMMITYRIAKLNHIMIECNYSDEILLDNIRNGIVPESMKDRLLHSHMEIETTKEVLRANDLSAVNEVVLLHLSDNNSNEDDFRQSVLKVAGKPVYCAKSGLSINLNKEPY